MCKQFIPKVNTKIDLSGAELNKLADQYFRKICRFDDTNDRMRTKLERGLNTLDEVYSQFTPKAVLAVFDNSVIDGKSMMLNNHLFVCNALEQISKESIVAIYAYIMTVGNYEHDTTRTADLLFSYIWGTAYSDAGRDMLKQIIIDQYKDRPELYVSEAFGPGYYGMSMDQVANFVDLLDGASIGVKMHDDALMIPLKSSVGFYLVMDKPFPLPKADCLSCCGNTLGCSFCYQNPKGAK